MKELRKTDPHYTLHLGDVYYTGTPDEVRDNFTGPDPCWHYGSRGTYVLPGNHEMYCNGKGFFVTLLHLLHKQNYPPETIQASSYWCLENKYWRIIGLDTGQHSVSTPGIEALWPPDTYIDEKAMKWLKNYVFQDPADRRGLIIMSHHQISTAFDTAYTRLAEQLTEVMGPAARDVVWIWGHEHRMAVYDKRAVTPHSVPAWGRCIGHGGMPVENKKPNHKRATETKLRHYDDRVYNQKENLGYNGFMNMEMLGPEIHLSYLDLYGNTLMKEKFTLKDGQITNEILKNVKGKEFPFEIKDSKQKTD
jgi:3',5'-cyclic AMP phosphodiesterase CpdA